MTSANSPQSLIDQAPMSWRQITAIAVAICLNGLDGMDVLSISFAAPLIVKDWSIGMVALGAVLSMELIGMVLGSMLLGSLSDRFGRRRVILLCLVTMAAGMAMSSLAAGLLSLCLCRILTGIGIGGMVVGLNTVASEFSNLRRRDLCVSLTVVGYPAGAVLGGFVFTYLLEFGHWQLIFQFGAGLTALFIPLVWIFMPESPAFLGSRGGEGALARVNASLAKMSLPALSELPTFDPAARRKAPWLSIFRDDFAKLTALVTIGYFGQIFTFYFVMKWTTKLVVDMGYDPATAGRVLVAANIGGIVGGILFGLLTQRFALKCLTMIVMVLSFLSVCWLGVGSRELSRLIVIAGFAGGFANTGVIGMFAVLARVYPPNLRGTGTGFAVGVGRGAAIFSPILAGALLQTRFEIVQVAAILATGSLVAAAVLFWVRLPDQRVADAAESLAH